MIQILFEKSRLELAKKAHVNAVVNYVKSNCDAYQQQLYNNIVKIMPQYSDFETLKQADNWNWLRDFILADVATLKSFVIKKDLLEFEEFKTIYSSKFCNGATVYMDDQAKYNAYSLCENLKITVCPYCDEEYLDILKSDKKRHFEPWKSIIFIQSLSIRLSQCVFTILFQVAKIVMVSRRMSCLV